MTYNDGERDAKIMQQAPIPLQLLLVSQLSQAIFILLLSCSFQTVCISHSSSSWRSVCSLLLLIARSVCSKRHDVPQSTVAAAAPRICEQMQVKPSRCRLRHTDISTLSIITPIISTHDQASGPCTRKRACMNKSLPSRCRRREFTPDNAVIGCSVTVVILAYLA